MDKVKIDSESKINFFLDYLNFLEAIKTACKAMHWGIINADTIEKRGNHIYLDELLDIISDYQDTIAEVSQGILGNYITPNNIKAKNIINLNNPKELCKYLLDNIYVFYNKLSNNVVCVSIKSETESFIRDIQKYNYLFNLCL